MADLTLAPRSPLAHSLVPGRHGRTDGEPGVVLSVDANVSLTLLLARQGRAADLRTALQSTGHALPERGRFDTANGVSVLWAGPDQWMVAARPECKADADRLVEATNPFCTAVDQSDGRAVIDIGGPQARAVLAKGVPLDLHARSFTPGMTALTTVAGIMAQIWMVDEKPTFRMAVPSSFAEAFWTWLTHAAAEYGYTSET